MKHYPDFDRAMHAIEEAVHATEIEGQDIRSLATSLLVHAAHYRFIVEPEIVFDAGVK